MAQGKWPDILVIARHPKFCLALNKIIFYLVRENLTTGRNAIQLEEYFDFLAPDDIRIKGHRIGIESVLYEYIFREQPLEAIVRWFPHFVLKHFLLS
jgi:hypothetical protein